MIKIIKQEEDNQRQLHVIAEIPEEEAQKGMRDVARKLGREMRFPGFRPGKVPYPVVLSRFGEETLRAEALESMLENVFKEVRQEVDEDPYLPVEISHLELKPMQVSFVFPLPPVVNLGNYRDLRRDPPLVTVSEEDINDALEDIRERHTVVEVVERPADFDDLVTVNGAGHVLDEEGKPGDAVLKAENQDLLLDNNRLIFGPEFVTYLIGMSAGEQKTFRLALPDNFPQEEYAGKLAEFNLTVTAVKRREVPELNDELARSEGDYDTLDKLRESIHAKILEQKTDQMRSEQFDQMIDDIRAGATLVYPPAAVKHEIDHIIEQMQEETKRLGIDWDEYVKAVYNTEDALRDSLKENSIKRLEQRLILREFIQEERLRAAKSEIKARARRRLRGVDEQMHDYLLEFLTTGRGAESVVNEVLLDKVQERFEAILSGNAPDLAELQAAAEEDEEE
ncbi:MAG: trigger factor [Candidatus Promineifilaceae bacterium]